MKISHSEEIIEALKTKVNESTFCDVQIIVGKARKVFGANSFLLALRSEVFEKMFFCSGMKEQQTKKWELPDVNEATFIHFLNYLYTASIELNGENVYSLLQLSEKYLFKRLNMECQKFLKKEISCNNALTMLEASIQLEAGDLMEECWTILDSRTKECIESSSSISISKSTMELLLARDSLNIKEINLFHFLIKWAKSRRKENSNQENDQEEHWKTLVKPFLKYIRFPLMSSKELIREVKPYGVLLETDLQYIEALEFNADSEFFFHNHKTQFIPRKGSFKELEDIFLPGPNYSLSNNSKTITKTKLSNSWDTTAITNAVSKGIHRWSLCITFTHYSHIKVGIAPHNIDQMQLDNSKKSGWYFYIFDSTLYSGPPLNYSGQSYSSTGKLGTGSIIDVELNMQEGTIRYFVNGSDCGIAYQGIPTNQPLRLAVICVYTNDSITLLSHSFKY